MTGQMQRSNGAGQTLWDEAIRLMIESRMRMPDRMGDELPRP